MKYDYLEIVDEVVMNAFEEGFSIPTQELWDMYAVKSRLELYGYKEEGRYYLNDLGIRYVMYGCSKGLKAKVQRQEDVEQLSIETQSFTKKRQRWMFRFAVASFILSILSILSQIGLLSKTSQWLSDLAQWICSTLS